MQLIASLCISATANQKIVHNFCSFLHYYICNCKLKIGGTTLACLYISIFTNANQKTEVTLASLCISVRNCKRKYRMDNCCSFLHYYIHNCKLKNKWDNLPVSTYLTAPANGKKVGTTLAGLYISIFATSNRK